jgi:hypothetical protein
MLKHLFLTSLVIITTFSLSCSRSVPTTESNESLVTSPTDAQNPATSVSASNRRPASFAALESFGKETCLFNGSPISGSTNQGGYAFDYESRSGSSQTGRCRWYGLRNLPGKLFTPAIWKSADEIFIDTNLPECKVDSTCPWIAVLKQALRVTNGKTSLWYGVNKNAYKDEPTAFERPSDKRAELAKEFPRLVTTISGVIADSENRPIEISLRVVSYVKGTAPSQQLAYEIQTGPRSPRFTIDPTQRIESRDFRVMWSAASSEDFLRTATEKGMLWIPGAGEKFTLEFKPTSIVINDKQLLTISQGDKTIFATTAPAYRPKER